MYRKPHQHRGRYFNLSGESLADRLKELLKTTIKLFKHNIFNPEKHDKQHAHKTWHWAVDLRERSEKVRITWLGHASFLIQMNNVNILTDPVFHEISRLTPRYIDPIPKLIEQLPPIDIVIISHNHRDHMDERSLRGLKNKVQHWLVPIGDELWFTHRGFVGVTEMQWWEKITIQGLAITFLPAHHWSGRHIVDANKSLWGSWMLQSLQETIYFAGDTAYSKHFEIIGTAFPKINVALMPIGPNEPASMRESHVSTEEAVQGFLNLGAAHFIPMHWGTFKFGKDTFASPLERLHKAWFSNAALLGSKKLSILKHGEHLELHR